MREKVWVTVAPVVKVAVVVMVYVPTGVPPVEVPPPPDPVPPDPVEPPLLGAEELPQPDAVIRNNITTTLVSACMRMRRGIRTRKQSAAAAMAPIPNGWRAGQIEWGARMACVGACVVMVRVLLAVLFPELFASNEIEEGANEHDAFAGKPEQDIVAVRAGMYPYEMKLSPTVPLLPRVKDMPPAGEAVTAT